MRLLGLLLIIFSFIKFLLVFTFIRKDIRDYVILVDNEKNNIIQNIIGIIAVDGVIEWISGLVLLNL